VSLPLPGAGTARARGWSGQRRSPTIIPGSRRTRPCLPCTASCPL
jgi:hypothetical protein